MKVAPNRRCEHCRDSRGGGPVVVMDVADAVWNDEHQEYRVCRECLREALSILEDYGVSNGGDQ